MESVVYQESPSLWRVRFIVKRSKLMEDVERCRSVTSGEGQGDTDDTSKDRHIMLGMYAARKYYSKEPLTVYVGTDIGAADGIKGFKALDAMACNGDGRHVMQIGDRIINGID